MTNRVVSASTGLLRFFPVLFVFLFRSILIAQADEGIGLQYKNESERMIKASVFDTFCIEHIRAVQKYIKTTNVLTIRSLKYKGFSFLFFFFYLFFLRLVGVLTNI